MSRVTVLTTVWNGLPYLKEAMQSVLAQTMTDFRFLVLDNGSTDGSADFVESVADPRISLVRLPENIGRTPALNRALELVDTEYTAVLDADDLAEPERLARQTAFLDVNPDVDLVGADVRYVDRAGAVIGEERFPSDDACLRNAIPLANPFAHAACTYRTEAARRAGGYPARLPYAQDLGLWLHMMKNGSRTASIPEFLARIRVHPGQTSGNLRLIRARKRDDYRLCQMMRDLPGMGRPARQAACFRAAAALWALGHKKGALASIGEGLRLDPLGMAVNPLLWKRLERQVKRFRSRARS